MDIVYSVVLLVLIHGVKGHNIDTLSPTIVNSGLSDGRDVGFGFTLTQHQFSDGTKTYAKHLYGVVGNIGCQVIDIIFHYCITQSPCV